MSITGKSLSEAFKKHPVSFGCGLLSLLLVAGYFNRSSAIPEREALLEQRTSEGNRLSDNLRYSAQLKDQVDALTAANTEIDSRAVRLSSLATNLEYFYRLEAETGIKLLDLRQLSPAAPARGAAATKHLRVPFVVSVQGDYAKVMNFLRRVERGPHFSRVNTATLSLSAASDMTLTIGVELLGLP
jgi:hypothetical protein